jgi:hypothetical protein
MFNFFKKKSKADAAFEIMDEAVSICATKWLGYNDTFKFKDDVALKEIIYSFFIPIDEGLRANFDELKDAPDSIIFMIVGLAVIKSKTHTQREVEEALGVKFPP